MNSFLEKRPILNKVFRGATLALIERAVRVVLNIFLQVLIARFLGPETYGQITYVTRLTGLFIGGSVFGLDELIVRELVKADDEKKSISVLQGAIQLRFLISSISYIGILVSAFVLQWHNQYIFWSLVLYGLVYFLYPFFVIDLFNQKQLNFQIGFSLKLRSSLGSSALKVVSSLSRQSASIFLFINFLENLYLAVGYFTKSKVVVLRDLISKLHIREVRSLGWHAFFLCIFSFLILLNQRYGIILVEKHYSARELGVFGLALTALDVCQYIPIAMATASYPAMVMIYGQNKAKYTEKLRSLIALFVGVDAIVFTAQFVIGPLLFPVLLGHRYDGLSDLLTWALLTNFFNSLNLVRTRYYTVTNRSTEWFLFSLLNLAVSVALQTYFVEVDGMIGVFKGVVLAHVVSNLIGFAVFPLIRETTIYFVAAPLTLIGQAFKALNKND